MLPDSHHSGRILEVTGELSASVTVYFGPAGRTVEVQRANIRP